MTISNRTSTLVRKIEFPFPILNGMAFGGPHRDILYVLTPPNYITPFALNEEFFLNTTSSLYTVTALDGTAGFPTSKRLVLH